MSINSISLAAIVPSLGPALSAPSLGPPSPLPNSGSSAPSPAVVDTSSSDESHSYCSIPEPGYQANRMRTDSPRPSPFKMLRLARPQNKTSFIWIERHFSQVDTYIWIVYENKYCPICQKGLWNTALMLTAKSGRGVHPIPPPQAELFTHTTVKGIKLATLKFQSRLGGQGANAKSCFFQPFP